MGNLLGEKVFRMPPIRMRTIEAVGENLLEMLAPEALKTPCEVNVVNLVDHVLPLHGVHCSPVSAVDMPDCEAVTDPAGTGDIDILIQEHVWDALFMGGARANRPRVTVLHELSHVALHVSVIRKRRDTPSSNHLLNRVQRSELKAYEDPEWQAFALAGAIAAPRRTIQMVKNPTVVKLAAIYGVSVDFMVRHLKRLKLEVPLS